MDLATREGKRQKKGERARARPHARVRPSSPTSPRSTVGENSPTCFLSRSPQPHPTSFSASCIRVSLACRQVPSGCVTVAVHCRVRPARSRRVDDHYSFDEPAESQQRSDDRSTIGGRMISFAPRSTLLARRSHLLLGMTISCAFADNRRRTVASVVSSVRGERRARVERQSLLD